jgi:cytochrome c biogenesis protein CcmG, thiol:disulfide interchange protein DsbE
VPGLVKLAREDGPKGLSLIGVSLDTGERTKVREFARRFDVPYPIAFPGKMSQISAGLEGIPTTILVDRKGRVAKSYVGAVRLADFEADVDVLLGEK